MTKPESSPFQLGRLLWAAVVAGFVWLLLSRGLNLLPNAAEVALHENQLAPFVAALARDNESSARAVFDREAKAHPTDYSIYLLISEACMQKSRYDLAIEYLKRGAIACEHSPNSDRAELYIRLSTCYVQIEKSRPQTQAIEAAKRAYELYPDVPGTLNTYGYVLADNGQNLDEAVRLTSRALQLLKKEPDSPDTQFNTATVEDSYGWALYRQGRFDSAVNALSQALTDVPTDTITDAKVKSETIGTLSYHLGAAYRGSKKYDLARNALQTALRAAPNNRNARSELDSLNAEAPAAAPAPVRPEAGAPKANAGDPISKKPAIVPADKEAHSSISQNPDTKSNLRHP